MTPAPQTPDLVQESLKNGLRQNIIDACQIAQASSASAEDKDRINSILTLTLCLLKQL